MDTIMEIVKPQHRGSDNEQLLIELLKEDRHRNKERIQSQRKRIVELTARVNGTEGDELEREHLMEHMHDMEENARKSAKAIEMLEQAVREREADIAMKDTVVEALQKQLAEAKKSLGDMREDIQQIDEEAVRHLHGIIDKQAQEIGDLTAERVRMQEQLQQMRKERQASTGRANTYDLMVRYAKSQGFKFRKNKEMAEAIERAAHPEAKTLADVFGEMEADCKKVGIDVGSGGHCKDNDDEFSVGLDSHEFADAVAMDKQPCPFRVEQATNKVAIVGGMYCRKKCPYNDGVDHDQNVVHCSKK